ncbi:MAG: hypothetical protein B9S32_09555 [Verrucomicrobia bacterium Tous-C9LFEB]|nr:MAG: hypothetical protein B9S32_09555 [Verrucomicrobia bacterium Tous-C9LFEB]
MDAVIRVTATTSPTQPYLTLNWPKLTNATSTISIYRRVKGSTSWGTANSVANTATTYADATASPGVVYEYSLKCSSSLVGTAYGAIVAGANIPLVENRGNVILLVDSTMTTSLSPEIAQLQQNLIADGWKVFRHDVARQSIPATSTNSTDYAPRLAEVQAVRSLIQTDYNSNGGSSVPWALLILGHVPVPYSGYTAPDGHPEHSGAWGTDTYYADINGTWTDTSTGVTNDAKLSDMRNSNRSGDGKFDQSVLPSDVDLQCGRVDLSNMGNEPTGMTEVELLRQYLVRNHRFRRSAAPFATVPRRGLIDDGFGYRSGEAFASSGWRTGISFFGANSGQMDALDWFSTLDTTPMLFGYGCGGGSFTSCAGMGYSTIDFNKKNSKAVFTLLFGSWFGDFDSTDNFLRSPLAGTANSLGLTSIWSGRGYALLYHMALGEAIGYSIRYSQNNAESPSSGGWYSNYYNRSITCNLMGDPTLRLHSLAPPQKVTATSAVGGITLNWLASPDSTLSGYHVYRATSPTGPFARISGIPTSDTNPTGSCLAANTLTYTDTDSALLSGTAYTYLVKAVRMEVSASGTYANQSVGEAVTLTHLAATPPPLAPTRLTVSRTAGGTCVLSWDDNANNETGYLVERRNPATGAWSQIASLPADTVTTTDTGATVGAVVHYRVRTAGSTNSDYSNTAADYNRPGLVYNVNYSYTVTKSAGIISPPVTRFNGTAGSVSVNYATANVIATAGTDYTAASGALTWAHNDSADKSPSIAIANLSGTQPTKIFKVSYSSPTNGLALNTPSTTYVFVNDPAALTLPNPWATTTIGAIISTDTGYSDHANGLFGIATRNGAYCVDTAGTSADCLRFTYQTVTGNFQFVARLANFSATGNTVRAGLMARSALAGSPMMDSIWMSTSGASRRFSRTSNASAPVNYTTTGIAGAPLWLRMTRIGSNFIAERSSDGITWISTSTETATASLPTLPSTLYVGLGAATDNVPGDTGPLGYARFDNVTLYTIPAVVTGLTATTSGAVQSGQIVLNWTASSGATSYTLERSTTSGSGFTQIATTAATSYTDSTLVAGQTYYYRVKATNPAFAATAYSAEASATPYIAPTANGWRYTYFGSESATGNAAPLATPAGDGIPNLMKYALGLNPLIAYDHTSLPQSQRQTIDLQPTLTYTFTRNTAATDLTYRIEVTSDPTTTWTALDPLAAANQVSVTTHSLSATLQVITVKDTQPVSAAPKRFMRLKVTGP